jgi:hypothetical protein
VESATKLVKLGKTNIIPESRTGTIWHLEGDNGRGERGKEKKLMEGGWM